MLEVLLQIGHVQRVTHLSHDPVAQSPLGVLASKRIVDELVDEIDDRVAGNGPPIR
jgi:hypothetical protein